MCCLSVGRSPRTPVVLQSLLSDAAPVSAVRRLRRRRSSALLRRLAAAPPGRPGGSGRRCLPGTASHRQRRRSRQRARLPRAAARQPRAADSDADAAAAERAAAASAGPAPSCPSTQPGPAVSRSSAAVGGGDVRPGAGGSGSCPRSSSCCCCRCRDHLLSPSSRAGHWSGVHSGPWSSPGHGHCPCKPGSGPCFRTSVSVRLRCRVGGGTTSCRGRPSSLHLRPGRRQWRCLYAAGGSSGGAGSSTGVPAASVGPGRDHRLTLLRLSWALPSRTGSAAALRTPATGTLFTAPTCPSPPCLPRPPAVSRVLGLVADSLEPAEWSKSPGIIRDMIPLPVDYSCCKTVPCARRVAYPVSPLQQVSGYSMINKCLRDSGQ